MPGSANRDMKSGLDAIEVITQPHVVEGVADTDWGQGVRPRPKPGTSWVPGLLKVAETRTAEAG
jgi:hypothetical protein